MKRYLVTGGAGFLGSNLCIKLLDEGHSVLCMDDLSTGKITNISHLTSNKNFEFVKIVMAAGMPLTKQTVDQYKKSVAATYFQEPPEETPDETDNGND